MLGFRGGELFFFAFEIRGSSLRSLYVQERVCCRLQPSACSVHSTGSWVCVVYFVYVPPLWAYGYPKLADGCWLAGRWRKKERREFSQCHRITSDTSSMLSFLLVLGVDERPELVPQVLGKKRKQRQLGYWSIYSASLLKSIICPLFVMYSSTVHAVHYCVYCIVIIACTTYCYYIQCNMSI